MIYVKAAIVASTLNPSADALFKKARLTLVKWQKCFSGEHLVRKVEEEETLMVGKRCGLLFVITVPFSSPWS